MSNVTILDAMQSENLMGASFTGESWDTWKTVLAATFGLPIDTAQAETFQRLAGGREPPQEAVKELYAVVGRRGAKSNVGAAIAVYLATIHAEQSGTLAKLSPGETGVIALIACDRQQARVLSGYIAGILEASPVMSKLIVKAGTEAIELTNGIRIEVFTNNFRAVRGRTLLAVILDEVAFFRSDQTASPDIETYRAVLPALATTGGLLIGISSPYSKRGLLWTKYKKHFGKAGDVLVVQGATRDFNPTLDQRIVDEAMQDDPEAAKAEWLGQFRSDLEAFIQREVVDQAVRTSPLELPFDRQHKYFAFTDPAGGGQDEFGLGIAHKEGDTTIVDVLRARRGTPAEIVAGYAALLKQYGVSKVTGDRFSGSWVSDEFKRHNIEYKVADKPKSGLYLDLLPALNSGRVELPPDDRLVNQLIGLERRTARGGRDSIDHAAGGHDDRSNCIAGLVSCKAGSSYDLAKLVGMTDTHKQQQCRADRSPSMGQIRKAGIPIT